MRGWRMLWELPESMRTVTGRLWIVPVNFRVLGDVLPVRAWGDK